MLLLPQAARLRALPLGYSRRPFQGQKPLPVPHSSTSCVQPRDMGCGGVSLV